MQLYQLPLICEGFQQIELDNGGPHYGLRFNRWADVPPEWEEEYLRIERTLSICNGLRLSEVFKNTSGDCLPRWYDDDIKKEELAITAVWVGIDDSDHDVFRALNVPKEQYEEATLLFNDFFDGPPGEHRHNRMRELFIEKVGRTQ